MVLDSKKKVAAALSKYLYHFHVAHLLAYAMLGNPVKISAVAIALSAVKRNGLDCSMLPKPYHEYDLP